MVYCGKPSQACHACRVRKTRCDAKPDGCTPCERARRICPGYRSQIDLIFRDQSTRVRQKAKAAQSKKSTGSDCVNSGPHLAETPEVDAIDGLQLVAHKPFDPLSTLFPTLEERATCHFVFHHMIGIHAPSRIMLDNLSLLYQSNAVDENLLSAVRAVSFASYGHYAHSSNMVNTSRFHYTKAINLTNTSLRCRSNATKDSTLLAIMVLSMYETLTGCNQRSLKAWMEHIRGSSALVKLRGFDQLKTPAGRRLFIQATTGILTSCTQLNVPVPKHVMELVRMFPKYIDAIDDFVDLSFAILHTMLQVNQFRASVDKGTIDDPHTVLGKALNLDRSLVAFFEDAPIEFRLLVLYTGGDASIAFHGCYHVYFDLTAANLWNAVRVYRILLHQMIRETLLRGFSCRPPTFTKAEHTLQFQASTDACYELQAEILASVPQHLGYLKQTGLWEVSPEHTASQETPVSPEETRSNVRATHDSCKELEETQSVYSMARMAYRDPNTIVIPASMYRLSDIPDVRASGGYNLLWPLWYAGYMDLATEEVRAYSIRVLRVIGSEMGIHQAFMLAKVLESKAEIEVWNDKAKFEVVEDG